MHSLLIRIGPIAFTWVQLLQLQLFLHETYLLNQFYQFRNEAKIAGRFEELEHILCNLAYILNSVMGNGHIRYMMSPFLPPASAVEVKESVLCFSVSVFLCFCVSVCQFVSTLTAIPFDVLALKLVQRLTLITSQITLMVKVIGQRRRSPGWKTWFSFNFTAFSCFVWHATLLWYLLWQHDVMWRHRMTSWRQMTSQNDVMTSNNISIAKTTITYTREVHQRWGVFIYFMWPYLFYILNENTWALTYLQCSPHAQSFCPIVLLPWWTQTHTHA